VEQSLATEFLKEVAVGFKTAKSYPPGHPVMEKVVNRTIIQLSKIYTELSVFSLYFLERTVIFQDLRIDVGKNPALVSLLDNLRKNEINSLTFEAGTSNEDIRNLYEIIVSPKLKIKEYGDAGTMLEAKGTQKIKINAVKFGIQSGTTTQVASQGEDERKEHDLVMESIFRNLKELVQKGISVIETKSKVQEAITVAEKAPSSSWQPYRDELSRIIEGLPHEQQAVVLQDIEMNPFASSLLSNLNTDTLTNLIAAKTQSKEGDDMKKIINAIGETKFSSVLPHLKEKIPDIYEYLAQVGLLLSEQITSTISKDDLRIAMRPYYTMLDSESAGLRAEGLRSLSLLANRFVEKEDSDVSEEIILRISTALEQESVTEVIVKYIDDLTKLYQICKEHNQDKFCSLLIEPFTKILGRGGLSPAFKKQTIKFLGGTGSAAALPMLFSFLWETGIYPDVREAIIKFGKDAVNEALLTLKEAEDQGLRRKLVDILKNLGPDGVEVLVNSLDSAEWFLKRNILAILGDIGDKSVIDRLVPFVEDEDDRVRLELVNTFIKFEYDEGLYKFLKDQSAEVKAEALRGLKDKIGPEAFKDLFPLFKQKGDNIHIELLKVIGEKKFQEATTHIIEFLESLGVRKDTAAEQLKDLGMSTLIRLNPENIKTILEDLKNSKDKQISTLAKAALKRFAQ